MNSLGERLLVQDEDILHQPNFLGERLFKAALF